MKLKSKLIAATLGVSLTTLSHTSAVADTNTVNVKLQVTIPDILRISASRLNDTPLVGAQKDTLAIANPIFANSTTEETGLTETVAQPFLIKLTTNTNRPATLTIEPAASSKTSPTGLGGVSIGGAAKTPSADKGKYIKLLSGSSSDQAAAVGYIHTYEKQGSVYNIKRSWPRNEGKITENIERGETITNIGLFIDDEFYFERDQRINQPVKKLGAGDSYNATIVATIAPR